MLCHHRPPSFANHYYYRILQIDYHDTRDYPANDPSTAITLARSSETISTHLQSLTISISRPSGPLQLPHRHIKPRDINDNDDHCIVQPVAYDDTDDYYLLSYSILSSSLCMPVVVAYLCDCCHYLTGIRACSVRMLGRTRAPQPRTCIHIQEISTSVT